MPARFVFAICQRTLPALLLLASLVAPALAQDCSGFGDPYGGACGERYHFTQLGSIYRTECTTDHSAGIIDSNPTLGVLHLQSWSNVNFSASFAAALRLEGAPSGVTIRKIRFRFAGTNDGPMMAMRLSFFDHRLILTKEWGAFYERTWSDSVDVDVVPAANGNVAFIALFELEGDNGLDATLSYSVVDLPTGARVVGCNGYLQEGPPLPTWASPASWGRVKAAYR